MYIIKENDGKQPKNYIHKNPSNSSKFKNKYDFITDVSKQGSMYKTTIYKWGYSSGKSYQSNLKYGYYPTISLLTKEELKNVYNYEVR